jgi:hypothetical protein
MKLVQITVLALFVYSANFALAQQTTAAVGLSRGNSAPPAYATRAVPEPAAGLSRAEVIADLQIWRASGLADLQRDPSYLGFFDRGYLAAVDRYQRQRSSPEFAALVRSIAERRGEALAPEFIATGGSR